MRRLPSDPQIIHRKDVPHLSESLLIGIERWRFVEGDVNELAIFMNRRFKLDYKRLSVPCDEMSARVSRPADARRRRHGHQIGPGPNPRGRAARRFGMCSAGKIPQTRRDLQV
jgi:hypothetical protein